MRRRLVINVLTILVIICVAGAASLNTAEAENIESSENTSGIDSSGNDSSSNDVEPAGMGDVNLDGEINYLDAIEVLRYDAELETLAEDQLAYADVAPDGSVDYLDAIVILRYDAELIDGFEGIDVEKVEEEVEAAEAAAAAAAEEAAREAAEAEAAAAAAAAEAEEKANALLLKTGNFESAIGLVYIMDLSDLSAEQLNSVVKIVADVTVDSGYCNGILCGYVDDAWSCMTNKGEISGEGKTSGQFVWNLSGSLVRYDSSGNLIPYAEAQLWRVENLYDEDGNASDGSAWITSIRLYDASGNIVKQF